MYLGKSETNSVVTLPVLLYKILPLCRIFLSKAQNKCVKLIDPRLDLNTNYRKHKILNSMS